MCFVQKPPKIPAPVPVPPPPPPPLPAAQDAATQAQQTPASRQRPQRVGASALRIDLTNTRPAAGNGLSIPR